MKVNGVVIPLGTLAGAREYMQSKSRFTAAEIEAFISTSLSLCMDKAIARDAAYRAADRLLQRERKGGRIAYSRGYWSAVGVSEAR
ncbi:hypothetical protein [Cupriavidus taiwanensis]|uniref:Uncharacterized protein n=1 Tax=Cupriavidus taiwanensis TaxID=164546 RepID=A0A375IWR1_9BURK|nr:hypothetical protein [Cupriavidus taiwanensis]SPR97367.1 conserved hypothetical protein [Cupriavidus taiwanensis]